jgi:hypothetical protein
LFYCLAVVVARRSSAAAAAAAAAVFFEDERSRRPHSLVPPDDGDGDDDDAVGEVSFLRRSPARGDFLRVALPRPYRRIGLLCLHSSSPLPRRRRKQKKRKRCGSCGCSGGIMIGRLRQQQETIVTGTIMDREEEE